MKQTWILLGFLTFGFGVLYWILKPSASEWAVDTDLDGLVDQADEEDSTRWLSDTSKYLYKYVNAMGRVDVKKTKPLCDCWDFPEVSERKILLCKDNKNWFSFEYNFYEYREDTPGDGRFYKNNETRVATSDDDEIEQYHRKLFPEAYQQQELPKQKENLTPVVSSGYSDITYKGVSYTIKSNFLDNNGVFYNNSIWRFKNNKFQSQKCKSNTKEGVGGWKNLRLDDINFILNKFGTKKVTVPPIVTSKDPDRDNPPIPKTIPKTPPSTNSEVDTENDKYWIEINKNFNNYDTKDYDIIRGNYTNKKPTSTKGKAALKNVKTKINM